MRLGRWRVSDLGAVAPTPPRLNAVTGYGTVAIFSAQLGTDQAAILELDGDRWSILWKDPRPSLQRAFVALATTKDGSIFALRADWSLVRRIAGHWSDESVAIPQPAPTFKAQALWAGSDGTVLASGTEFYRSGIYRLDGARWVPEITNLNTDSFHALWGRDGFAIAVGNDGSVTRADRVWSSVTDSGEIDSRSLRSLWGTSTRVYGVGGSTIMKFITNTWRPVHLNVAVAADVEWFAIAGVSSSDIVAVGDHGIVHYR